MHEPSVSSAAGGQLNTPTCSCGWTGEQVGLQAVALRLAEQHAEQKNAEEGKA